MENLKSLEQILLTILTKTKLSKYVLPKDLRVLRRRISAEGATFLTQKLPLLDKGLLLLLKGDTGSFRSHPLASQMPLTSSPHGRSSVSAEQSDVHAITPCPTTPQNGSVTGSWQLAPEMGASGTTSCSSLPEGQNWPSWPQGFSGMPEFSAESSPTLSQASAEMWKGPSMNSGDLFPGFSKAKGCVYPCLFRLAWANIFEKDGSLRALDEIDTDAVQLIRQASHLFYKLELPYTDAQMCATIEAFKKADIETGQVQYDFTAPCGVLTRARRIVRRLMSGLDPMNIHPRHGSGASACRVEPYKRYESFRYIPRLAEVYPYDEFFFYSPTHLCDELHKLLDSEELDPLARACFVPKDSRGPRFISMEPRELMFIQQGQMRSIYEYVESKTAIAAQIGFLDQSRNQELARIGSITGEYATIDCKEASDRLSWELVQYLFPENWVKAFAATRSQGTLLPNGDIVTFNKFAPMGSAVCFPVETICFWAIALAACGCHSLPLNRVPTDSARRPLIVSVFGDDIIVPTRHAHKVIGALQSVGLVVNTAKSFLAGPFRESCGGDYFNGNRVVPVRCKAIPTSDDMHTAFRTAEMFNNLIRTYGYERIGLSLELLFEEIFGYRPPVSSRYRDHDMEKTSRGLYLIGRYTDVAQPYKRRYNRDLQVTEYRIPCSVVEEKDLDYADWSLLLRKACLGITEMEATCIPVPNRNSYKYRWTQL